MDTQKKRSVSSNAIIDAITASKKIKPNLNKNIFDQLPKYLKFYIFSQLTNRDLFNLTQTNKCIHESIDNNEFWRTKIKNEFFTVTDKNINAKEEYKKLIIINAEIEFIYRDTFTKDSYGKKIEHLENLLVLLPKKRYFDYLCETFILTKELKQYIPVLRDSFNFNEFYHNSLKFTNGIENSSLLILLCYLTKYGACFTLKEILNIFDGKDKELIGKERSKTLATLLLISIVYQRLDILKMLIEKKADINYLHILESLSLGRFKLEFQHIENVIDHSYEMSNLSVVINQLLHKLMYCYEVFDWMDNISDKWVSEIRKCDFLKTTKEMITMLLNAGSNPHMLERDEEPDWWDQNEWPISASWLANDIRKDIDIKIGKATKKEVESILDMIINVPNLEKTDENICNLK